MTEKEAKEFWRLYYKGFRKPGRLQRLGYWFGRRLCWLGLHWWKRGEAVSTDGYRFHYCRRRSCRESTMKPEKATNESNL